MKIYVFADKSAAGRVPGMKDVLWRIAGGTDTRDPVVLAYFLSGHSHWKAHTMTGSVGPDYIARAGRGTPSARAEQDDPQRKNQDARSQARPFQQTVWCYHRSMIMCVLSIRSIRSLC